MATTPKQSSIGPFPGGMDNRRPAFALSSKDTGDLLRDAVNVDVTDAGTLRRRAGSTLVRSGADCHSLWSPRSGAYALYADAGDLYRLKPAADGTLVRNQIAAGFGRSSAVSWAEVNEAVYFTDGLRVGSFHPDTGPTPAWMPQYGVDIQGRKLDSMPAGQAMAYHRNRTLVACGPVLFYSEPFAPHLYDPAQNFVQFPARITLIAALESGVYVATADATYFAAGGFPAQGLAEVAPYGAAEGSLTLLDGADECAWMSPKGIVRAKGGEFSAVQEPRVVVGTSERAACVYREHNGLRQVLASLADPTQAKAGVGSFIEAETVRKGIVL